MRGARSLRMAAAVLVMASLVQPMRGGAAEAVAPAPVAPAPAMSTTQVDVDGATIRYVGMITADANLRLGALLAAHPGIRTLVIESIGGEVGVGMDLGDLVRAHGLDVRAVGHGCASSCANYVFTSARHAVVEPGAVVVWHGSMIQPMLQAQLEAVRDRIARQAGPGHEAEIEAGMTQLRARMAALAARQHAFFVARGIDERLTVLGHEQACGCVWTLDAAGMAAFGLHDVVLPPGYPDIDDDAKARGLRLLQPVPRP